MVKIWRKWDSSTHLYEIGCDTCGWRDVTETSVKAGRILARHSQLLHNEAERKVPK